MLRLFEFARMIIYVMMAVVMYLGLTQLLVITDSIKVDNQINLGILREGLALGSEKNENDPVQVKTIDRYLQYKESPLAGSGEQYVRVAKKYNIPVYLMVAMAGVESGFGKYGYAADNTFNSVGLGVHEGRRYNSWNEGIEDIGYVLRNYYFDEGLVDPISIQNKWAPRCVDGNSCDDSWADGVIFFISELEVMEKEISSSY